MDQATLPIWVQILALFGLPALGTYVGMRVGLVRLETRMEAIKEKLREHNTEIRILRKRSHNHSNILGRLAVKVNLTGGFSTEDEDRADA